MQTDQIVSLLIAERDRLSQAIDALQGGVARRSQAQTPSAPSRPVPSAPVNGAPKKRRISAAGRKAIAEAARRRWAAAKANKAEAASPSDDEQFKKRMSEVMKASWAKRKKAA
ncbi:MAG TPA: hypothetical protein VMD76_02070 [Candidatus Sulfotelmatobacter sp.]|nr:hypothetical protein [Candidatus Sulfotelmatobacter sp.]